MNENRQYNLDLLKALAIICMIFSHPVLVFALYRNGWDSGFLYILGEVIFGDYIAVAHAFMLAMGVGMVFSRKNDPASLVKRGIKIFLGGYVLNFFRRGMYLLITDLIRHETGTEALDAVLAPDILQFAGLALIVTGIFFKLKLKEIHILIIGIALSIIGALVPAIYTGIYVLDVILGNFIFVSRSCSTFVFCSWYVFVAAGLFFGSLLRSCDDKDRFYKKLLWSGCVAAVYIAATFILGMFYFTPDNDYYRVGIADAAGLLSMDLFALSVFYFVLKKTGAEKFSAFIEMSRNITPIYVIHWCIIGFTDFVLCELLGFVFTYPIMYAYGAVLIIVSFFLARLYRKEREKRGY